MFWESPSGEILALPLNRITIVPLLPSAQYILSSSAFSNIFLAVLVFVLLFFKFAKLSLFGFDKLANGFSSVYPSEASFDYKVNTVWCLYVSHYYSLLKCLSTKLSADKVFMIYCPPNVIAFSVLIMLLFSMIKML